VIPALKRSMKGKPRPWPVFGHIGDSRRREQLKTGATAQTDYRKTRNQFAGQSLGKESKLAQLASNARKKTRGSRWTIIDSIAKPNCKSGRKRKKTLSIFGGSFKKLNHIVVIKRLINLFGDTRRVDSPRQPDDAKVLD